MITLTNILLYWFLPGFIGGILMLRYEFGSFVVRDFVWSFLLGIAGWVFILVYSLDKLWNGIRKLIDNDKFWGKKLF